MAKKYFWYTEKEVLSHLDAEYQSSKNYINAKRDLFRARLKDYTNITSDKKNIYVRLIYSVMQMMLAMHYQDTMTVEFSGRQLWADEIAEHLQYLAEFDYEEMDMEKIMYQIEWDRLFFWKAFLVYDHWDNVKQHPVYRRVSPMAAVLDVNQDKLSWPNFYQFELEIDSAYLTKENGFFNTNKLSNTINQELELNKQKLAEVRELTHQSPWSGKSYTVPVHYCYTTLNNEKYFIVTAMNHGVVLKMEKIEAIFSEEQKDPQNIKFPVIEFDLSPLDGDPFGVSVPDLIADKQRALQLLLNLEKTKAVRQALGGKRLVNTQKVNIRHLLQQKEWPDYIPHKGSIDVGSTVVPIPQDSISGDILSVSWQLSMQAKLDIGLDEQSLGISGWRNVTATENQRVQKNANLRQILNTRIKMRGLKSFWNDWYKRYYDNFKWSSEKNIIINSRIGTRPFTVRRKDIITGYDVDIKIVSKSELEAKREGERVNYMAMLPLILNDPDNSKIAKRMALRKAARLNGATSEEARLFISMTVEEEQALLDVELLNRDEPPAKITNMWEDHMTYIVVYQKAHPTSAKYKAIEARKTAYILSWQQVQARQQQLAQQQLGNNTGWGALAQMTNAAIQENKEINASSLQDI